MTAPDAGPLEAAARAIWPLWAHRFVSSKDDASELARAAIAAYLRARAEACPPADRRVAGICHELAAELAAELAPAPAEKAPAKGTVRCQPVWGSCNLPSGHKGPHDAYAQPSAETAEGEKG